MPASADMVWVAGRRSGVQREFDRDSLPGDDADVRVCVYRVPASEQGGGRPAGDFLSVGKLPTGRWAAIKRELDAAGPAAACRTPAGRFAVLHLQTALVYVEADGCRRVLVEDVPGLGAPRQGTAKLASLVFGK